MLDTPLHPADWHAAPRSHGQAEQDLREIHARLRALPHPGASLFHLRLREMIAHWWLGRDVGADYRSLLATARDDEQRALAEIVYGQLLMSCRVSGALEHLERGFELAAPQLAPADYFRLLRRHRQLAVLPLSPRRAEPAGLDALERQAGVIRRLEEGNSTPTWPPRGHVSRDTLG